MKVIQEFKEFAVKGNVIDLAVGVVIGAAFGKIVSSLVDDIIMPPIGYALSGIDFQNLAYKIGTDTKGQDVLVKYGSFINNVLHFLIVAFAIFVVIKQFNRLKKKPQELPPSTKKCLFCKETIAIDASKCKFCTGDQPAGAPVL